MEHKIKAWDTLHNLEKAIGKLVVVSQWVDFDFPMDAVCLGILERYDNGYYYIEGSKRGFKHCRPVSEMELRR